ncbi:hypothetical protein [Thermoleptolyngbya sp.]
MSGDRLATFQEAYRNLDLLPLLDQRELERFRVSYGEEVLEELQQLIEDDAPAAARRCFRGIAAVLSKADYDILTTTYAHLQPDDPKAQEFLDLLHGLHVLEYRNAKIWYDLHPIVIDLLKRKGLITA